MVGPRPTVCRNPDNAGLTVKPKMPFVSCVSGLCLGMLLDEENMDTSPQTNYHLAYSKALDTHTLAEPSLSLTSLGDKDQ